MLSALRRFLIGTFLPSRWRGSPAHLAASFEEFARVEEDSGWQFLRAVDVLPSPAQKAEMFLNALEEMHHSSLFHSFARAQVARPAALEPKARKALLEDERGLADFLAYIYVGERDVYQEFESYSRASGNAEAERLFAEIRGDEEGHQESGEHMLAEVLGSDRAARRAVRWASLRRMYADWLRFSEALGSLVSGGLLSLIYFVSAPLFAGACRRRLAEHALAPAGAGEAAARGGAGLVAPALSRDDLAPGGLKR